MKSKKDLVRKLKRSSTFRQFMIESSISASELSDEVENNILKMKPEDVGDVPENPEGRILMGLDYLAQASEEVVNYFDRAWSDQTTSREEILEKIKTLQPESRKQLLALLQQYVSEMRKTKDRELNTIGPLERQTKEILKIVSTVNVNPEEEPVEEEEPEASEAPEDLETGEEGEEVPIETPPAGEIEKEE